MKRVLILFLSVCIMSSLRSQDFALGLSLGSKYKPVQIDNDYFYKGLGLTAIKSISKRFFLQADLSYVNSRTTNDRSVPIQFDNFGYPAIWQDQEIEKRDNYLAIPLTLNFKVFNTEGINLFLSSGLSFEYLFSQKVFIRTDEGTYSEKNAKGTTLSLDFGVGAYVPVTEKFVFILKPQLLHEFGAKKDHYGNSYPNSLGIKVQFLQIL